MDLKKEYVNIVSKFQTFLFFLIIIIFFQIFFTIYLKPIKPEDIIHIQTTISVEEFLEIINFWKTNNLLNLYLSHFKYDFIYPIVYSLLLSSLIANYFRKLKISLNHLFLFFPFIAMIMDYIENIMHILLINNQSLISNASVFISGLASNIKWGIIILSILIPNIFFIYRIINRKKL